MKRSEIDSLVSGMAPVIREFVDRRVSKCEDSLLQRIAEVESQQKELRYCGTWTSAKEYRKGNFVTHAGGIWHADEDTGDRPGASNDWTLAVKSGDR